MAERYMKEVLSLLARGDGFPTASDSSGSDVAEQACAEPPSSDSECKLDDSVKFMD